MTERTIHKANLRDVSYILANLRPEDEREVSCQLPVDAERSVLAAFLCGGASFGDAWVAKLDGQPVVAFGTAPINVSCRSAWLVGTRYTRRMMPLVTGFFLDTYVPQLIERGMLTCEARSWVEHDEAHSWMRSIGARTLGPAFPYGRDGEDFFLFRWTVAEYRSMQEQRRRRRNVHSAGPEQHPGSAGSSGTDPSGRVDRR